MKGFTLFFLWASALAYEESIELNHNGCPIDHRIEKLLPHGEICSLFFQCANGELVLRVCPPGLHFSVEQNICDWPDVARCNVPVNPIEDLNRANYKGNVKIAEVYRHNRPDDNDDVTSNENESECNEEDDNENYAVHGHDDPSQAPVICAAIGSDSVLVAHENCDRFYQCSGGRPLSFKCPGILLYNPSVKYCDWPSNVNCGHRVISEDDDNEDQDDHKPPHPDSDEHNVGSGHSDPSEAPAICAAKDSDGTLVAHEICNQFYICSGRKPMSLKCPRLLLYNPKMEICDWANNVVCGDRVMPKDDESDNQNDNEDQDDNKHPHPDSGENNHGGGHSDPSEAPAICESNNSDGVLVAHEKCNQFYQCSGKKPVSHKCPGILLYNHMVERCDWPSNVECGDRVLDNNDDHEDSFPGSSEDNHDDGGDHSDPSEAPAICAAEDSHGVLVAHEYCNQFNRCTLGHPVALVCPGKLLYNSRLKNCDWSHNVDCGNRLMPDNQVDIADPAQICAGHGTDNLLTPHENCNQFYQCYAGKPHIINCPLGLHFNYELRSCDWPENVNCGVHAE